MTRIVTPRRWLVCALLVLLAVTIAGCGKKGDPTAMGTKPEPKVSELRAFRSDNGFHVQWPVREGQGGDTLFRLEKSALDPEGGECPGCPRKFETVVEMKADSKTCGTGRNRQCRYEDNDAKSGSLYIYKLYACDRSGRCENVATSPEVKF